MQSLKIFLVIAFAMFSPVMLQSASALTLDYNTAAYALVEVCWYDYYYGYICLYDSDSDENIDGPSYTSAYYEIQYGGKARISTSADASIEPNEVILSTELSSSYELDVGWVLLESFYQDANSVAEGRLQITEFPIGAPCRLQVNVSFPQSDWIGLWAWQVYIESSSDYFLAGRDSLVGDYGSLSGSIDAYAGEQIYAFLGIAGRGYADHEVGDRLGYGTLTINVSLTATPHLADLSCDGYVDFQDFALFSSQWLHKGCEGPDTNWCKQADLDQSGQVDHNDLDLFAQYWLLLPDANQIP